MILEQCPKMATKWTMQSCQIGPRLVHSPQFYHHFTSSLPSLLTIFTPIQPLSHPTIYHYTRILLLSQMLPRFLLYLTFISTQFYPHFTPISSRFYPNFPSCQLIFYPGLTLFYFALFRLQRILSAFIDWRQRVMQFQPNYTNGLI